MIRSIGRVRTIRGAWCLLPALALALTMLGCKQTETKSTETSSAPPPAPASDGAQVETKQMEIDLQVEGAEATQTGPTSVTIDYPVLKDKNDLIPDWVINPGLGRVLGAVGVATPNKLGVREQLDEARISGRLELASMLETRLQKVGRTELEEEIVAANDDRNEARKGVLGVDRNILDIVMAGTRQRALWFDPESGDCYIWLVFDGGVLKKVKHYETDGVSVFLADQEITTEYVPERRQQPEPTVIVNVPEPQAPPPPPEEPKTPAEELESNLKPIETIPLGEPDKAKKK